MNNHSIKLMKSKLKSLKRSGRSFNDDTDVVELDLIIDTIDKRYEDDLPIIPEFIHKEIALNRNKGVMIGDYFYKLFSTPKSESKNNKVFMWVKNNQERFTNAYLNNYLVAEQRYYIKFGENQYAQKFNRQKIDSVLVDKYNAAHFTKEEIKELDNGELFWLMASYSGVTLKKKLRNGMSDTAK